MIAGKELIALGRSSTLADPDPGTVGKIADLLGAGPAVTAVELAAAFAMTNRVMEATGQPVLVNQRRQAHSVLEQLGALDFPHSGLTTERARRSTWRKVVERLRS